MHSEMDYLFYLFKTIVMILNTTKLVQYVVYIKFMASGSQVFKNIWGGDITTPGHIFGA